MPGAFFPDKAEDDAEWDQLLGLIDAGLCVPFLGAGACYPHLPNGGQLATQLAKALPEFPWEDTTDLLRVAQFAAVTRMPFWVKRWVSNELGKVTPPAKQPEGAAADEPHRVLASMPLPLYFTTNYDLFMYSALADKRAQKKPHLELCRWNSLLTNLPSVFQKQSPLVLNPATPVVYHLHGHLEKPESMVLTEDDYLDFLEVMLQRGDELLPATVTEHLKLASILFIGYRLADWNFRLLLRSLKKYAIAANYMVLKPPEGSGADKVRKYFAEFYGSLHLRVFWGTAQDFSSQLAHKWKARTAGN